MRSTTATIESEMQADGAAWVVALLITLPLRDDDPPGTPPVTISAAEGERIVGGVTYVASVKARGAISFTEGAAVDGSSFTLANNDETFGRALSTGDRYLDGATAALRIIVSTSLGYEVREVGSYYLDEIEVDQNEKTVSFNLVSDLSRKNVKVGGEQVTQRCIYKFNVGGLVVIESGRTFGTVGRSCAWALAQGGDATFCDHTLNGPKGCKAHNNAYHIGAVPELEETARVIAGLDDGDDRGDFGGRPDPRDPRTRQRGDIERPYTPFIFN